MRKMRWPLLLLALGPASTALAQLPAPGDALVGLVAEDGALALDLARRSSGALWIANTGEGTVARFDTATREETGRFFTGPLGPGNDPSRTSVDPLGDAYVANRAGNRVTRIASQPEACPDRDGDGTIDTSWGRAALGWGADECVLWSTGLDAHLLGEDGLRAVAVQDGAGGDPFARFVWVGGYVSGQVAKLDAETGEVLFVVDAPVRPYGFALDGDDQLWIATRDGRRFGRIDTLACTGVERCAICDGEGVGDGCAAQRIAAPVVPYGVTVDGAGRVWLGGTDLARYDPAAPVGRRWARAGLPWDESVVVHGVVADGVGGVWGALLGRGLLRADAEDPARWRVVEGSAGPLHKGLALDDAGQVWSITLGGRADVALPVPGSEAAALETDVLPGLVAPYTYSDMTGAQLRLGTGARGALRRTVDACAGGEVAPWTVEVRAATPAGTRVAARARAEGAEWRALGILPDDAGVWRLAPTARLEVELQLEAPPGAEASPRVSALVVTPGACAAADSRLDADAGAPSPSGDAGPSDAGAADAGAPREAGPFPEDAGVALFPDGEAGSHTPDAGDDARRETGPRPTGSDVDAPDASAHVALGSQACSLGLAAPDARTPWLAPLALVATRARRRKRPS